jgi:hypothetical protein
MSQPSADFSSAASALHRARSEFEAALERQSRDGSTPQSEAEVAKLDNGQLTALERFGRAPTENLDDLLAKIAELGRWRAEDPDEFCILSSLDTLIDGIIADAKRLRDASCMSS